MELTNKMLILRGLKTCSVFRKKTLTVTGFWNDDATEQNRDQKLLDGGFMSKG